MCRDADVGGVARRLSLRETFGVAVHPMEKHESAEPCRPARAQQSRPPRIGMKNGGVGRLEGSKVSVDVSTGVLA